MIGHEIADLAKQWIGTPFVWQGCIRGVGCDCKGLVAGVALEARRPEATSLEALCADYGTKVNPARLQKGLAAVFDRTSLPAIPGDILLIKLGGIPQHLAICTAADQRPRRMVHCHPQVGQVVEVPVGTMVLESIASIWRWRDI